MKLKLKNIIRILFCVSSIIFLQCKKNNTDPDPHKGNIPVVTTDTTVANPDIDSSSLKISLTIYDETGKPKIPAGTAKVEVYDLDKKVLVQTYQTDNQGIFSIKGWVGNFLMVLSREHFTSEAVNVTLNKNSIAIFERSLLTLTGAYASEFDVDTGDFIRFNTKVIYPTSPVTTHTIQIFVNDSSDVSKDHYDGIILNYLPDNPIDISYTHYSLAGYAPGTKVYAVAYVSQGFEEDKDVFGREKCYKLNHQASEVVSFNIPGHH